MAKDIGCSRDWLDQPAASRLAYFKRFTMAHPLLKETYEQLRSALREPAGIPLIFVTGATGVGKTTLRRRIEQKLAEEMRPALETDPGRIPVVGVEAIAPDSGHWSWRDYYLRLLRSLNEPLIDKKVNPSLWSLDHERPFRINPRTPIVELRYAVEQALVHRRPIAVFVDEAQHLAKIASGRKLQDQLDCIKSLANVTQVVHVLVGSYELLAFRNLSGQLSRRSIDVHFRRYQADRHQDMAMFRNGLRTFQRHLPLKEEPDLLKHADFLYERSLGCVGVLKDWLSRVLAAVLEKGKESITTQDLEAWALSVSQCERILSEAIEGETILEGKKEARRRLRQRLGIEAPLASPSEEAPACAGPSKPHPVVGVPNPRRYPIGERAGTG